MPTSSNHPSASHSTLHGLVLQRIAGVKNLTIAAAIGHDEGHVSRITSGERGLRINELEPFFKSLGLRVIECEGPVATIPAEELAAIKTLAGKYFK
jgi:hypothetical protein